MTIGKGLRGDGVTICAILSVDSSNSVQTLVDKNNTLYQLNELDHVDCETDIHDFIFIGNWSRRKVVLLVFGVEETSA